MPQRELFAAVQGKPSDQARRLLGPAYYALIEVCPDAIKRYIGAVRPDTFTRVEQRYGLLERARAVLSEIADLNASGKPGPRVLSTSGSLTIAYLDQQSGFLQLWTPLDDLLEGS
jgi:hypothetical protein